MLIQVMYQELPEFLSANASLIDIASYFAVALPGFLTLLLPLSMLVSLLYVLGQMHRQHEFTALRAAGVGLGRITLPIWIVGLLFCWLIWWFNSMIVPWSVEQSRGFKERIQFQQQSGELPPDRVGAVMSVTFDNRQNGRLWFINRYSRFTGKAYGLTLSFLDAKRHETRRLFAAQAWPRKDGIGWVLHEGREILFDPQTREPLSNIPFLELKLPELNEDPGLMLLIDRHQNELSFGELERLTGYLKTIESPKLTAYLVRYHSLLADTLAPLIIIGLSIPFVMTGVRTNPVIGISKSISLFALYYILAQVSSSFAGKHLISAFEAAWIPNLGMALLAIFLFSRLK